MLYDQIMEIYGFYIIMSGVLTFVIGGAIILAITSRFDKKLGAHEGGTIKCNAKVIEKKRRHICFETETGQILELKINRKSYYSYFENDLGCLTYRGNKVISFE